MRGHVLQNAMLPIVSMLGMDLGIAFAGALFIESAFGLPGIGQLLYQSTLSRDLPVIMGIMLVVSIAIALSTVLADIAVSLLDPRVGLRSGSSEPTGALVRRQRAQAPASITSPTA
jgi:peptide/nickel transport system permease protein